MRTSLTPPEHGSRASRHRKVGDALASAGEEWAFVCFFYGAYHLVKAALLCDPVFDDPIRLAKSPVPLRPDDRFVSRHRGRRRPGVEVEWGVNDLVATIYRFIREDYELLHQLSIEVRYGACRSLPPLAVGSAALDRIEQRFAAGNLKVTNF